MWITIEFRFRDRSAPYVRVVDDAMAGRPVVRDLEDQWAARSDFCADGNDRLAARGGGAQHWHPRVSHRGHGQLRLFADPRPESRYRGAIARAAGADHRDRI